MLSTDQAEAGLDAQEERVGLIGHSHIALFFVRAAGGRRGHAQGAQASDGAELELGEGEWLLNPGSVGQPRDGDPRAAWLELDTEAWTARYHRVDYDIERRRGGDPRGRPAAARSPSAWRSAVDRKMQGKYRPSAFV